MYSFHASYVRFPRTVTAETTGSTASGVAGHLHALLQPEGGSRAVSKTCWMGLNTLERRAAHAFKERLLVAAPGEVVSLRVYGSRARGEAREDSDMDVLVLTVGDPALVKRHVSEAALGAEGELGYPFVISPLVMSRAHFDELLRRERLLARAVMEEGIEI